jgi:phosphatidate cytidylyltransferase
VGARLATAVIGVPLLALVIWYGYPWLPAILSLLAALAVWELHRLGKGAGADAALLLMLPWAVALVVNGLFGNDYTPAILSVGLLASLAWFTWAAVRSSGGVTLKPGALAGWAFTVAGPLYIGWPLSYALLLRDLPQGREWLLLVVLATFATDTLAFFTGRTLGRRRLAPSVSPGKTVEGALGGLAGGVGASLALGAVLRLPIAWWEAAIAGAVIGVVAQVGDLAESWLKRVAGAKDASHLVPGHGGLLDRLDSVVFTLVVMYYVVAWVA